MCVFACAHGCLAVRVAVRVCCTCGGGRNGQREVHQMLTGCLDKSHQAARIKSDSREERGAVQ